MPVGVQMLARAGAEKILLRVGAALEDAAPEFKRLPPALQ